MVILQSGDCYYNGTDAESVTFTSTLVVHVILLFIIFIYFLNLLFLIEDLFFSFGVFFGSFIVV